MVPSRLAGRSGIRGAVEDVEATALSNAELRFVVEGPATAEPPVPDEPFSSHGLGRGGIDDDIEQAVSVKVYLTGLDSLDFDLRL